jgi:pSer/pThr/pTyr-binding forkhead associated (FHA) protein
MTLDPSASAWFETASGVRYSVPSDEPSPINVGRAATPGGEADGVGIPHSEQSKFVSRRHATLWRLETGGWEISDAGSASGLWVGGVRAEPEKRYPLPDGAPVRLGNYELTFRFGEEPAGADRGSTMVLRNFEPTAPVEEAPAAPAAAATGEKYYFDSRADGQPVEIEIPTAPGVARWTIGRAIKAEENDPSLGHIVVPNLPEFGSVSRRHVMLACEGSGAAASWTIKNLSNQGSRLNGEPLANDPPTPLASGGKLVMGNRVFIFRVGAIKPHYNDADFEAVPGAAAMAEAADGEKRPASLIDTREIATGSFRRTVVPDVAEIPPWGQLVENRLIGPRIFPMRKRKVRIGSHPINCDIKLDDQGIEDQHASVEWHGKDCKIHSRAHDAPVRVNHAAYRVSPPLSSGDIVTLGNQEFHIDISGMPPEATGTVVLRHVRRALIVGIFSIILICAGTLLAARMLTPRPHSIAGAAEPEVAAVVEDVLSAQGLAGLPLLLELDSRGALNDEQRAVVEQMKRIAAVNDLIDKSPEREFRGVVSRVEADLQATRGIFQTAGLSASMADQGWFKQIQDRFHARRREAYSSEWSVLLTALRDNNLANARRMLGSMTNTQQELLDQAEAAVERWEKISNEMRARTQVDLLDGYMTSVKSRRGARFLATQRQELGGLVGLFDAIQSDLSEASDALMQSNHWPLYREKMALLDNSLKTLEGYRDGNSAAFDAAYQALPEANRTSLLKALRLNLNRWDEWRAEYAKAGNASARPALIAELSELRLQFNQSQDADSPLVREIESKLNALQSDRGEQAVRLRQEAARMPEGFARVNKLLDAFRYDANFQAESEIDAMVAKLCGDIMRAGTVAANLDDLKKVRSRIDNYVGEGQMSVENMTAIRQIDNLIKQ